MNNSLLSGLEELDRVKRFWNDLAAVLLLTLLLLLLPVELLLLLEVSCEVEPPALLLLDPATTQHKYYILTLSPYSQ